MPLITTLIDFVYEHLVSFSLEIGKQFLASFSTQKYTPAQSRELLLPTPTLHQEEDIIEEAPQTFKPIASLLVNDTFMNGIADRNTIMYAGNISVPVYTHPTLEFDTQIGSIPYGELVMMLEARGRFYKIMWGTTEGWVLREDLVDRAVRVYPEFVVGEENSVDHTNTAHIRAILKDPFGLGRSEFPLQAGEYVLYRLWRRGIHIAWPDIRPRTPGLWHKILKGTVGVHIGMVPKVGSLMEYLFENEVGHLAYVEAVFPDNTIAISEVNYPDAGIYNERQLTKDEWKEYRPVFIHAT